jgi:DNA invertase Pin-like site-specific DNA recombinase
VKLAALYARISTAEQQSIDFQLADCRKYCERMGWKVEYEFSEQIQGKKIKRPERDKLLKLAMHRKIDVVVVWRLDRWGRSVLDLSATIEELMSRGVNFVSVHEAWDLNTPHGKMMFQMLACFAEFEHALTCERIRAGIADYKSKHDGNFGRPASKAWKKKDEILAEAATGATVRAIAARLGLAPASVHRVIKGERA